MGSTSDIWFSILARRVLRYGSFTSVAELTAAVRGFITHWNAHEAHPFRWTFRGHFRRDAAEVRSRHGALRR